MPEIKIKHVVSFSSEDKIHKAENIMKPETYRKWKCATPGEKNASIVLQFEKATQIHSIDIGNESSAFIEVLVGRSSDTLNDFQVLLVASSFMTPLESRNETHTNRVRMFGPDKLAQNLKDEKWDRVQVVCSQPFNRNITYGLTFIKFHSLSEKIEEIPKKSEASESTLKLGAFKLKSEDEDDDAVPSVGSWFGKHKQNLENTPGSSKEDSLSYAAAVFSSSKSPKIDAPQNNSSKRKYEENKRSSEPPVKKASPVIHVNKEKVGYKDILPKKASDKRESDKQHNSNVKGPEKMEKKLKMIKIKPFDRIMEKVVFSLSGFVNPLRSELRDKALEIGAKYKADWDDTCTHLVCAFLNTPKYVQVRIGGGRIVTKYWIIDCYKKKALLPWRKYMLGDYSKTSTEESESDVEVTINQKKVKKDNLKLNGASSSNMQVNVPGTSKNPDNLSQSVHDEKVLDRSSVQNENSETDDEDAIIDYMADTDVDSDSGGDTEDEIRKIENKAKAKMARNRIATSNSTDSADSSLLSEKPDISNLPLPDLPNLFKNKHFFLFGDFSPKTYHDLQRYITAYNGVLEDYMSDKVKYVITESRWDKNFDQALSENEDLIFVKPLWIFKCHESGKLVPYQPYIIIPDS